MRALDDVLLPHFGDPQPDNDYYFFSPEVGVHVYDGDFDARPGAGQRQVNYKLPYAIYHSSTGREDPDTQRLSADIPRDQARFSLKVVGTDRKQTKWAIERLQARLRRLRPVVSGFNCDVVEHDSSAEIYPDETAVQQDGTPLFYGVERFAVGVRRVVA